MEILVAEDDPVTSLLITETLSNWGHTVINAEDGEEAIALLKTHQNIRLLVVDWSMPIVDGVTLCQRLKNHSENRYYIIMMTGKSGAQNTAKAIEAGADDFIAKPFSPDKLRVSIESAARILAGF